MNHFDRRKEMFTFMLEQHILTIKGQGIDSISSSCDGVLEKLWHEQFEICTHSKEASAGFEFPGNLHTIWEQSQNSQYIGGFSFLGFFGAVQRVVLPSHNFNNFLLLLMLISINMSRTNPNLFNHIFTHNQTLKVSEIAQMLLKLF